jgi:hypothetical protein
MVTILQYVRFRNKNCNAMAGLYSEKVFHIDPASGKSSEIKKEFKGNVYPSYTGKYLLMYDEKQKQYSVYNPSTKTTTVVLNKFLIHYMMKKMMCPTILILTEL